MVKCGNSLALPLAAWFALIAPLLIAAELPQRYSGYLGGTSVYENLTQVEIRKGDVVWRWIDPAFSAGRYNAVLVEDVVFYPEAVPGPRISADTLLQVKAYLSSELRSHISAVLGQASAADYGVLRMQSAITGVKPAGADTRSSSSLAALFGAGKAPGGGQGSPVRVFVETRLHDSMSGRIVGLSMREFTGPHREGSEQELQLEDLKEGLDRLVDDATSSLGFLLSERPASVR